MEKSTPNVAPARAKRAVDTGKIKTRLSRVQPKNVVPGVTAEKVNVPA